MRLLLVRFLLLSLLLLLLSRLGLIAWQWPRVAEAGGLWPLLLGGLRIDLSLLAIIGLLPALLAPWLGHRRWPTLLTAGWLRLWWLLLVVLEVATPQFILEYDLRPNRLFIEYLVNPREVAAMLWQGYKLALFGGGAVIALLVWAGWRLLPVQADARPLPWQWRPLVSLVAVAVLFLAARGTLAHRPLNPALVAHSSDTLVNTLALNSAYSVAYAVYQMGRDKPLSYGEMAEAEMHQLIRAEARIDGPVLDPQLPTLRELDPAVVRAKPLNLVILVQESLGAQYVGALGGRGLTPELDKLINEGWAFTNLYATGTRSVRGLEALTTGFLPTPAMAVVKLPKAQNGFFSLAGLLDQHGYRSRFVYGGESHFDNMRGFFLGNGFDQIHDLPKFTQPGFVGSWGASDEDMFNELHQLLLKDDQPSFTLAFTVSNHSPWEYPAGRIQPDGDPATVDNTVRYADWAMGQFFARARQSAYWHNTLFLVVADHDARVYGASDIPLERFHIPAVIVGADLAPRLDNRLVSQIDLAPTLLSLMGLETFHPMVGVDLLRHSPERAMMQYDNNFGLLSGDQLLVLKPQQAASQFQLNGGALTPIAVDKNLARRALAYTLWPVWAYQSERYRVPEPQRYGELLGRD